MSSGSGGGGEREEERGKERSPSPAIKSTAVVKYTAMSGPVGFARLQCNTDLNLPPSNWLSGAIESYGLKQIRTDTHSSSYSSFRMAHMFPDCVGEVDVISGAECIKTLLKLPYQPNGTVSMMVHRVENTLLLDEFNIYEYLMKSEWAWLRSFFYENILKTMNEQERMRMIEVQKKGTSSLQLTSKFLCHSVATQPEPARAAACHLEPAVHVPGPFLPEPEVRAEPPDEHSYSRNVLWTFEDIRMLIGSDLPIFGGSERPCVSLRLRDANEPINVLTGVDYWLDNLMCNVPEVLMCYHIDGIVQRYEPMKTEELPQMEGSKFSPRVIRNVAQNILSFLKSNATKSGHTYWLFKGARDDVVKLYDLTSLYGGLGASDSSGNPFATPVAMLLYRVARNMRLTRRTRHVRTLLENTIKLLSEESHPQIVASSHYMLSDMYVPATTNPAAPDFKDESSEDSDCEESEDFDADLQQNVECDVSDPTTSNNSEQDVTKPEQKSRNSDHKSINSDHKSINSEHKSINSEQTPSRSPGSNKLLKEADSRLALKMCGLALHDIGKSILPVRQSKSKGTNSVGLGTSPPDRCGKALQHALRGLQALHNVTIHKCKEEERERLLQQRLLEEQNPKMANPCEPIKLDYEPLAERKRDARPQPSETPREHARGRRRKRERKTSDSLIESKKNNVDKNAILIRKENMFPTWQEPSRDDNFAWKLHLKTLLYEKICLAYATLAEFSYANEQYGFSLKYISLASKCQKLLSNMIIKSQVVDESCLIGRAGDNYFQLSKHWARMPQFKMQFETDHEVDGRLRAEIEKDLSEETAVDSVEDSAQEMALPADTTEAMRLSCERYRMALSASEREKRNELMRRLASVNNELGVRYMHLAQEAYMRYYQEIEECKEPPTEHPQLREHHDLAARSLACLDEATDMFQQVDDIPNLALLYCNKGRYMRFKAHCQIGGFSAEQRRLYGEAEALYARALRTLGGREARGAEAVRDLVCWELSSAAYTRATLQQDHAENHIEANDVIDALKNALKHCNMSPGSRQYLYQFRAAMIYHRLGSLYHKQLRETREEGARRRTLAALTRANYEQAAQLFALLEDCGMCLTVRLEHVAMLEGQAAGSPSLKLKSLQSALQLLRQSGSIVQLVASRDPDESPTKHDDKEESNAIDNEHKLLSLFEHRLQFILKSLIQYCRTRSNKDYERMALAYKEMYSASLKIRKVEDLREYAGSLYEVIGNIENIAVANGL